MYHIIEFAGPASGQPSSALMLEEEWKTEADAVCSNTDVAMTLSVGEMKDVVGRCVQMKTHIESQEESTRKVYLRRLQMSRDIYKYVLEIKERKWETEGFHSSEREKRIYQYASRYYNVIHDLLTRCPRNQNRNHRGTQTENKVFTRKNIGLSSFLLLAFSCLAFSGPSDAANERWKAITGKTGDDRILYDPDSVIPSGPRVFRVRIMGFDKDHFTRRSLEEFDCTNKIFRDIEVTTEKPNKPVLRTGTPSEWRGIVKESPRGELFKILCR